MDAYGFPWCAFGRAPDVESMENEFPMIVPMSSHWKDSGGAGKHRGGVGTAQLWVAHHAPFVFAMAIADNSIIQTPQPLFGGYSQPTVPGVVLDGINVVEALATAATGSLTLEALLRGDFGGEVRSSTYGSAIHPVNGGDTIIIGLSTGGTGYGDPIDRDVEDIDRDLIKQLVSPETAANVYGAALDRHGRVDRDGTVDRRALIVSERLARGVPYDQFEEAWLKRKPSEEILQLFGSWPDGAVVTPVMRP
jgi:acetophenone carboxylase